MGQCAAKAALIEDAQHAVAEAMAEQQSVSANHIQDLLVQMKELRKDIQTLHAYMNQLTTAVTANKSDSKAEIKAAGGIAPLVELVRSGSAGVQEDAAGALRSLAINADNQVAIAVAGVYGRFTESIPETNREFFSRSSTQY